MINVREYQDGDALVIPPHGFYSSGSQEGIDLMAKDPTSTYVTFCVGSKPVGVAGINIHSKHNAEVVMLISEELQKFPQFLHKTVKTLLNNFILGLELRRVQATVRDDFCIGKKWLYRLGFEQEGLLRKFGSDGHDYTIWSRI